MDGLDEADWELGFLLDLNHHSLDTTKPLGTGSRTGTPCPYLRILFSEESPLQRSVALFARAVPGRKGAHLSAESVELICFAPPSAPLFFVELAEVYLQMGDSKGRNHRHLPG